jgi:hypothetical protein
LFTESDSEVQKDLKDEQAKCSPSKKKMLKNKKAAAIQKPIEGTLLLLHAELNCARTFFRKAFRS